MIFSLAAMTGLEKCSLTSAYLQWLCHSGERPVGLLFFFFLLNFVWTSSITTGRIVLKFGDMIDMDMKFCKRISKDPLGVAPPPLLHKRPNISETIQIPVPKPYIFLFLTIRCFHWHQQGVSQGYASPPPVLPFAVCIILCFSLCQAVKSVDFTTQEGLQQGRGLHPYTLLLLNCWLSWSAVILHYEKCLLKP